MQSPLVTGVIVPAPLFPESSATGILDRLPASVARFDRACRITYANARLARMLGCGVDQLLGSTCASLGMPANIWNQWQSILLSVFTSGVSKQFEYLTQVADGEHFVQVWVEPERGPGGEVESVLALAITNNKVQDLRVSLQTQTDLFTAFMDHGRIYAWMRNEAGGYVYANTPYLKLFGLKPEDLYGTTLSERWPPDVAERFRANDTQVLANWQPLEVLEPANDADGNPRTWLNVKFPFRSPEGVNYVGGIGIDLTDYLRLEEERREVDRQLYNARKLDRVAEMAAGVAHEFNNLLTTMLGNVSLARMNPGSDENLVKIENAALRAAKLSQLLINYCGRGQMVHTELDLNVLLNELKSLTGSIVRPPMVLTLSPSPVPVVVRGDQSLLKQALIYLITNAVESMAGQGKVVVATGVIAVDAEYLSEAGLTKQLLPGSYAYLEVIDTGSGMDEATLARIFEPFFTTKHPAQMGLGLSAVQGIVREHQGGIVVRSQVGRGSHFMILLPAIGITKGNTPPTSSESEKVKNVGRGRIVLVIDDEPEVCLIASRALTAAGFQVRVAEDGKVGLEVFRAMPFDISAVLLDLTMPRLNGPATYRELRRLRPDLPVILTSGYTPEDATSVFTPQDLAGFLHKPFRPEDLLAAVLSAIGP